MSKETKVIKEQESNKFVIDNSGLILLCEVSYKDDGRKNRYSNYNGK